MRAVLAIGLLAASCLPLQAADPLPQMKFNDVKEIAPGVFFRYSAISPTNPSIFGGSNNIWIVFQDHVVVVDANFPKEAGDVIAAIKKTTDKPIRYVLDTHHHGDHAYGNAVFGAAGASIVAQANCARLLRVDGPSQFAEQGRGPNGRKDVAASYLKVPNVVFDDRLVLDDGTQRVEFLFLGHAHTAGDAVAYLPRHKILCTGDACVNGAYNFMGHSDSASWIRALERMQQLDVKMVAPGHGPLAGKELLEKQKRYFVELRRQVRKGIADHKDAAAIHKDLDMAWYKEWTGVPPTEPNVQHVFNELTGRVAPWDLSEDFGIHEGPSPTKDAPGWKKARRIVVSSGLTPAQLEQLKGIAPEVEFIPAKNAEAAVKVVEDADAVLGFCTSEILKAGKNLRWVQVGSPGVPQALWQDLGNGSIVVTDTQGVLGPDTADQTFALLLALTRQVNRKGAAGKVAELHGKTIVVVGLGADGRQVARRAHAFGMRVRVVDMDVKERPAYVFSLDRPERLMALLPGADVVVLTGPLTKSNLGLIGADQLKVMKKSAYLINSGAPGLIVGAPLAEALQGGRLAGVGIDAATARTFADEITRLPSLAVYFHNGPASPESRDRQWRLYRENVRRFVAGEHLLCVVDKVKGD
jgi:phosphoglycerate dehydrogenase-like enzyme/glyoxylase-like metal-dependent hydrolase (beta-lactamase superfamily II)